MDDVGPIQRPVLALRRRHREGHCRDSVHRELGSHSRHLRQGEGAALIGLEGFLEVFKVIGDKDFQVFMKLRRMLQQNSRNKENREAYSYVMFFAK